MHLLEQLHDAVLNDAGLRSGSRHCECFARARLSICKNRAVDPFHSTHYDVLCKCFIDFLIIDLGSKDTIYQMSFNTLFRTVPNV